MAAGVAVVDAAVVAAAARGMMAVDMVPDYIAVPPNQTEPAVE